MSAPNLDDERYQRAKSRVDQLRGFYTQIGTFAVITVILFVIDVASGDGWWFYWSVIGWGIFLLWRAMAIFGPKHRLGEDWERRKIQEEMEKDGRK